MVKNVLYMLIKSCGVYYIQPNWVTKTIKA